MTVALPPAPADAERGRLYAATLGLYRVYLDDTGVGDVELMPELHQLAKI